MAKPKISLVESVYWRQGIKAFLDGLPSDSNPYLSLPVGVAADESPRLQWFQGFYDTQRTLRWGKVQPVEPEDETTLRVIDEIKGGVKCCSSC